MTTRRPSWKHYIEYAAWTLTGKVIGVMPRRIVILAADLLGWVMYSVLGIRKRVIDEQLAMAFGETKSPRELRAIALRSWQNCVLTFFEFLAPVTARTIEVERDELLDNLHPHQAIVISGHTGNWEDLSVYTGQKGILMTVVGKAMHNPMVDAAIYRSRLQRGIEVVEVKSSMKRLVNAVRSGRWIGMMGDQDARRNGIFVRFFGKPASTAVGPAMFAWKLNLPLLPMFCIRLPNRERTLKVVLKEPIWPDTAADRDTEVRRLTELHVQALEKVVREYPENYFWLHRRWKTQPRPPKKKQPGAPAVDSAPGLP